MTSDPETTRSAPAKATPTMTVAPDEVEVVKVNTAGGDLEKELAVSQPCSSRGSPLVDIVGTNSDDCELERRREDAAVVNFIGSSVLM